MSRDQPKMAITYVPMSLLDVSPSNARHREIIADVDELAHSMDIDGLQQPIVVQPKNGRFEIIVGQRRFLAAKQLRWTHIPAFVRTDKLSDLDVKVVSFSENVQRRDLNPRDKADACSYLLRTLGSVDRVAERLSITPQTVRKWLGYAAVPEGLKRLVDQKQITPPLAMRLSEFVTDEHKAVEIGERIAQQKPPKSHRDRIIAAIEEAPDRPIDTIFRRAEEKRREKQITFILPEKWGEVMDRAVTQLSSTPEDIARDATVEWLKSRRF